MKKKTLYEDSPFGKIALGKRVHIPGLPTPEEIAADEKITKITLSVSDRSLQFFKTQAKKYDVPYQIMIRRLLDAYVPR